MKDEICIKFGAKLFQAEESAEIDTGRQEWSWCLGKKTMSMEKDWRAFKNTGLENFQGGHRLHYEGPDGQVSSSYSKYNDSLQLDVFLSYVF